MKKNFWILIIILLGAFLRFYGLNWGLPYPFHPDERNMAAAITRFSSNNLNPEFFAYGQFPLYLSYFSSQILAFFFPAKIKETLSFTQAIIFLRFWSALFSTATIYVGYLIAKKLFLKKFLITNYQLLITPLLVAFTPGLIQAAHFGTTESVLAFSFLAITYFSLNILEKPSFKNFFWAAFFLGIALGSKISAVIFLTPLFLASLLKLIKTRPFKERLKIVLLVLICLILSLTLTILTSPYLLLAKKDSLGTLLYEVSVAEGKSLPFYTRQFTDTTPILFQFQKIFPYALGCPLEILGTIGFLLMTIYIIFRVNPLKNQRLSANALLTERLLLITLSFLAYFLSNVFLFAKWTRFMTPIFPFFSIFAGYFLSNLIKERKISFIFYLLSFIFLVIPGLIFSQIYFKPDIRFTASEWIYTHIPSASQVLFDTANVVDIPVPPPKPRAKSRGEGGPITNYSLKMISFNFYDLDQVPQLYEHLLNYLETSDYIFVPSRRVFMNHLRFPEKYPLVTKYYQLLFSGKLGFKEIKTFYPFYQPPITSHQLLFSDEQGEETFTVFDHPVIRIYKKTSAFAKDQYEKLFK